MAAGPSYCTPDDVRLVLAPDGDQSRDNATGSGLSDAELTVAIGDAAAQVDAALGGRYAVPFDPVVPPVIRGITRDVAAYLATLTLLRHVELARENPVALRYQRAIGMLKELETGTAALFRPSADTVAIAINVVPWESALGHGFFGQGSIVEG